MPSKRPAYGTASDQTWWVIFGKHGWVTSRKCRRLLLQTGAWRFYFTIEPDIYRVHEITAHPSSEGAREPRRAETISQ